MDSFAPKKKERVLTREAYDKLLFRLDPDPGRAAERFDLLRFKLVVFFEKRVNHSLSPEDLADETIDRVVERIAEGAEIRELWVYCISVAKNVSREHWREPERNFASVDGLLPNQQPFVDPGELERLRLEKWKQECKYECWEKCLQRLPVDSRQLFIWHNQQEGHSREIRDEMAEKKGLSRNALNIKISRIRREMEECCIDCLQDLQDKLKGI